MPEVIKTKFLKLRRKRLNVIKKEGWKVISDNPYFQGLMEEQLDLGYYYDMNEDYTYAVGSSGLRENINEANEIATHVAEHNLAENISIIILGRIESELINRGCNNGQYETFSRTLATSISIVLQQNVKTIPVLGLYRETKDGKYEVRIGLAYKYDDVVESVKEDLIKKDERNKEYIEMF